MLLPIPISAVVRQMCVIHLHWSHIWLLHCWMSNSKTVKNNPITHLWLMILLGSCWMRWMTGKATDCIESPPIPCKSILSRNKSLAGSRTKRSNLFGVPGAQKMNRKSGTSSRKIFNRSTAKLVCSSLTAAWLGMIRAMSERPATCTVARSWFNRFCEWFRISVIMFGKLRPGSARGVERREKVYRINKWQKNKLKLMNENFRVVVCNSTGDRTQKKRWQRKKNDLMMRRV